MGGFMKSKSANADHCDEGAGGWMIPHKYGASLISLLTYPGGALGYFFGGYVPPGTPNWHPVLEKFSPKIRHLDNGEICHFFRRYIRTI